MRLQTKIFVAKQFAKKHYASAMDAMKSLKSKIKKPTGMKAKAMAAGSKVKTFAKKNKVALVAGGGAAGTVGGYQAGKKKERKVAIKSIQRMGLSQAAGDLGIRSSVRGLSDKQKMKIFKKYKKNIGKDIKQYRSFYS